jgi:hypothetical protein
MPIGPRTRALRHAVVLLLAARAIAGCGGKEPTPPPDPGTVAIAMTPTSITVPVGAFGTAGATITRAGGFTGDVTLTSSGAPAGMTIAFAPAALGPVITTSILTATVGATVAAGAYPITLTATANLNNQVTGSVIFTVTVTAAASTSIAQSFCAADAPIWAAYQDGAGAWTRVTAGANNTYSFTLTSARGGFATVDTVGSGYDVNVIYATATELASYSAVSGPGTCTAKTLNGSVANVSGTQFANVSVGNSTTFITGIGSQTFQLRNVPDGAQDVFAARVTNGTRRADKLILRRGVNIAANGTIPVFDFNAAEAFASGTANVTVTGLSTDSAFVATVYNGTRGIAYGFLTTIIGYSASSGAQPYDAIPGTRLNTGELQNLYAVTSTPNASRFAGVYFRAPVDRTLALAPYLSSPAVTRAADTPYARPRVLVDLQTDYNRMLFAEFAQTSSNRSASVTATRAWVGGAAWDVTFPDLSAAAGWNTIWPLRPATPFTWTVGALGGAIYQLDANVADGAFFKSASIASVQAVP